MKLGFRHIFFSLLITFACGQGQAATIIYSGIGDSISGSLGGVVFSNAAYTITLPSDTANIIDIQALYPGYPIPVYNIEGVSGIGSIEIAGVGTATFTNALGLIAADQRIFGGTTQIAFRLDNGAVGSLPFISGDFDVWDLTDPYSRTAPVDPTMPLNVDMGTSMGALRITGISGNITFTTSAIPEPSRALLSMAGLGILAMRRRRRGAHQNRA
jgi:hypothetical protein